MIKFVSLQENKYDTQFIKFKSELRTEKNKQRQNLKEFVSI